MIWLTAVWTWLKKWWKWLLLPIGVVLWFLGRSTAKKTVTVVSPELVDYEKVARSAEAAAQGRALAAAKERDGKISVINQDYDSVIAAMDAADERRKKALENDPIALNRFLKEVGSRDDKG